MTGLCVWCVCFLVSLQWILFTGFSLSLPVLLVRIALKLRYNWRLSCNLFLFSSMKFLHPLSHLDWLLSVRQGPFSYCVASCGLNNSRGSLLWRFICILCEQKLNSPVRGLKLLINHHHSMDEGAALDLMLIGMIVFLSDCFPSEFMHSNHSPTINSFFSESCIRVTRLRFIQFL